MIFGVYKADNPVTERLEIEQLKKLLQRIIPENALQDSVLEKIDWLIEGKPLVPNEIHRLPETKAESFLEKENDQIGVQNAGLILLHPFLKQFFATTGIQPSEDP